MNLYYSHQDEIEEYSSVIELVTEAGIRKTTVFNELGKVAEMLAKHRKKKAINVELD